MDNPWNLLYQLQWEHRQLSDKYDKEESLSEIESLIGFREHSTNVICNEHII